MVAMTINQEHHRFMDEYQKIYLATALSMISLVACIIMVVRYG
jgi:hypothetical protein